MLSQCALRNYRSNSQWKIRYDWREYVWLKIAGFLDDDEKGRGDIKDIVGQ